MGGNEYVHVADIATRLQSIHLKEEEAYKLVLHLIHLCKPHGYALELYARREALGKLSIYEVEDQPAARMTKCGGGWADRCRYVVLECVTLDELAAFAQYHSLQDKDSPLERDIFSGALQSKETLLWHFASREGLLLRHSQVRKILFQLYTLLKGFLSFKNFLT
jgi:hypothetical protein